MLNRRDLVDIRKQLFVVRSIKFIKKNWISAVATIVLSILFTFIFVADWDDNPNSISADGNAVYIENKNGKVLWKINSFATPYALQINYFQQKVKIVDIDNDGTNEVLSSLEDSELTKTVNHPFILRCFDKSKKIIWTYQFKDNVKTSTNIIDNKYGGDSIIDTITFNGKKSIFLISSSEKSFSSAVYCLELKTGKRLPGTFWASGHNLEGKIKDVDNDGKHEFVGIGYDNGYEDLVFFVYALDTLTTVRPTTENYLIRNYPICNMKAYIRFPKTDFDIFYGKRTPIFNPGSFRDNKVDKYFSFAASIVPNLEEPAIGYDISYNFKDVNVVILSNYRVRRDSLVVHGKLQFPLTDTDEYCNILKSKILYWNGKKFVYKNQLY